MALPITIPYTFANATSSIPLSQLDSDFTTVSNAINGIGNGTNSLSNVSITGGTINNVNVSSSNVSITGGTIANVTQSGGLMLSPTQRVNNSYPSSAQANQVNVTAAPAGTFNTGSISTAFQGDMIDVTFAVAQSVSGASTLGTPTTGYKLNPQVSGYYNYLFNSSGYNYSTSINDGRTLASLHFDKVDNYGQGDATAFYAIAYVNGAKAGATSWLANPAASLYIGECDAGANGVFLNPIEVDCNDNGYDAAAVSFVSNLNRTNNTAALGQPWIGFRSQSIGTKAVDAFLSAAGSFNIGLDLTTATLGASNAAITLKQGQTLYFGSTNSDTTNNLPNYTTPGGAYIVESGNILSIQNGTTSYKIETNTQYFSISGSEKMRIDSSGNVMIGIASSSTKFTVSGTNASGAIASQLQNLDTGSSSVTQSNVYHGSGTNMTLQVGNGYTAIINSTSAPMLFSTNNSERMRIDSSGNVGIGTSSPNASAILDAQSTTKGVRFPNMTTTQKNAVSSPAAGLVVFDTTLAKLCVYSGSAWQTITSI